MQDNVSDPTDLKTQYAAQVATDLENNTKKQERIGADIAELQQQLGELQRDHALLLTMQRALAAEPTTAAPAAAPGDTVVSKARLPRARTPKDADRNPRGVKRAKRTAEGSQPKGSQVASAATEPAKGRGARRRASGEPTLREVVSRLLANHREPRSAAEITTALAGSYPEREVSPTVVRNTLEALVAKGQAHRSKQQKSVFYSAVSGASAGASGADRNVGGKAQDTADAPSES
jgi:predicted transcriptional regulator